MQEIERQEKKKDNQFVRKPHVLFGVYTDMPRMGTAHDRPSGRQLKQHSSPLSPETTEPSLPKSQLRNSWSTACPWSKPEATDMHDATLKGLALFPRCPRGSQPASASSRHCRKWCPAILLRGFFFITITITKR